MYLSEEIKEKWQPVMEHPDLPEIKDPYKRDVTRRLLQNQDEFLSEAAPANRAGDMASGNFPTKWDPILIALVRRAMPQMIAYDVCGVQPMPGPTGLIFAMKAKYDTQGGGEALFDEADGAHSSTGVAVGASGGHTIRLMAHGQVAQVYQRHLVKQWVMVLSILEKWHSRLRKLL